MRRCATLRKLRGCFATQKKNQGEPVPCMFREETCGLLLFALNMLINVPCMCREETCSLLLFALNMLINVSCMFREKTCGLLLFALNLLIKIKCTETMSELCCIILVKLSGATATAHTAGHLQCTFPDPLPALHRQLHQPGKPCSTCTHCQQRIVGPQRPSTSTTKKQRHHRHDKHNTRS